MKMSIVIPTYNEGIEFFDLLNFLKKELLEFPESEVIVVDGESEIDSSNIVNELGFKSFITKKGRGNQLYFGAEKAHGDVLYFLHADSKPPQNFIKTISQVIENGDESGCFGLKFTPSNKILRFYEYFVKFNFLVCRGGDQSLFVTRGLYKKCGGFNPKLRILEDIDIIQKLKRISHIKILKEKVTTSSRKYQENGMFRLQVLFAIIHFLYWLRVSNDQIFNFYNKTIK